MAYKIKRIYEDPSDEDGFRVLVDRLWPRGVSKQAAQLDMWMKEIAPSTELRKWFDHAPPRFKEFQSRYDAELDDKQESAEKLLKIAEDQTVTLLYAAKDQTCNHAIVLKNYLEKASGNE